MSGQCQLQTIYKPFLNLQVHTETIDLIIIGTSLPIQFIFIVLAFRKGYVWVKKFGLKRKQEQAKSMKQQIRNGDIVLVQEQNIKNAEIKVAEQQNQTLTQTLSHKLLSHPCLPITLTILFFLLYLLTLILLTLTFFSIYQTTDHTYPQIQCHLSTQINEFRKGSSSWLGLENLVPTVTQLSLVLNTRIQVSINAIRGLMLNGTLAKIKPGLGFANGTNITVVNRQSPLNLTIVRSTSVKSNINASVRYWLFMNSSLSNTTLFPVCQPNLTYPIQHPLTTGQTIELNYMNDICSRVTKEVDDLVENGAKVDQLLGDLQEARLAKTSLESNLSVLNEVYSPIASRTNEYASEFSSFAHDFSTLSTLSIVSLATYGGIGIAMTLYIILISGISCCSTNQTQSKQESQQESQIHVLVLSVRDQNKRNNQLQRNQKNLSVVSSSCPKLFILLLFSVNVIICIVSYLSIKQSIELRQNCLSFSQSINDTSAFNQLALSPSQKQLLTPIHQCTSNQSTYFLQSVPLLTSRFSLQKLFSLSATYNASVPKDVFKSQSLSQVQTLKQYLFHLQTMPIKSSRFNLLELLTQINLYSNGSYVNSKQLLQCCRAVIQDQYVYNAVDCKHRLMDLVTETSITQPRCIILPTYDGTPGTATTRLNQAQHTFVLDATCPSINNMFSKTNSSCFLAKRLAFLQAQNCTNTAKQLGTRLQNIVKFSQKASEYTDIYMQNLRNMFGIYATSSTNLTQFFAGANMSQTMGAFGTLSNSLLNLTKCSQIQPIIQNIYNSYCPQNNSMSKVLSQAYIWSVVVVVAIVVQSIVFFWVDVLLRLKRIERFYGGNRQGRKGKKVMPEKDHVRHKMIEISQETLVREHLRQDEHIYQDQFNKIAERQSLRKAQPIIIIAANNQPFTESKPTFGNCHTLDETGIMFDKYSPSPMKSINPYGNGLDEVIEYPKIGDTPEKLYQDIRNLKSQRQRQNKSPDPQVSLLPSIKKPNKIQDYIFLQKDSSPQQQQNVPSQQQPTKQASLRQSHQRQGKLMMSQTARRFKKVNVQTDERKIMPQLFFNLDEGQEGRVAEGKGKIRTNNNKTQQFQTNGGEKVLDLSRSKNFLEIYINDDGQDHLRNANDIEVMNLKKGNQHNKRENVMKVSQQKQRKDNLTAR